MKGSGSPRNSGKTGAASACHGLDREATQRSTSSAKACHGNHLLRSTTTTHIHRHPSQLLRVCDALLAFELATALAVSVREGALVPLRVLDEGVDAIVADCRRWIAEETPPGAAMPLVTWFRYADAQLGAGGPRPRTKRDRRTRSRASMRE